MTNYFKQTVSVEEYNRLYDLWYETQNRADLFQCLFIIAAFFLAIFGLTLLTLI